MVCEATVLLSAASDARRSRAEKLISTVATCRRHIVARFACYECKPRTKADSRAAPSYARVNGGKYRLAPCVTCSRAAHLRQLTYLNDERYYLKSPASN